MPTEALSSGRSRGRWLAAGVLVLVAFGALAVHSLGAKPPAWYPRCWFQEATGLYCPGCGTARCVHALMQGSFARALDQNAFTVAVIPVLAAWGLLSVFRLWMHRAASWSLPDGWARWVLAVVIVFTVLRNLPWWPFVLLAPD